MALDADGNRLSVGDTVIQIGTGKRLKVWRVRDSDHPGVIVDCETEDHVAIGQTGRQIRKEQ